MTNTTTHNDAVEYNFSDLETLAPFWTKDFKTQVQERQGLDKEQLAQYQRQTVRYSVNSALDDSGAKLDGNASYQGWSRALSESAYQKQYHTQQYHHVRYPYNRGYELGKTSGIVRERLPQNIRMEITQAPAEFACPVKQDKRLSPDFKVKVTLKYIQGQEVYLPVTMKAIVIAGEQYSKMGTWLPPELCEEKQILHHDKKFQFPLKGTDTVLFTFSTENPRPLTNHLRLPSTSAFNAVSSSQQRLPTTYSPHPASTLSQYTSIPQQLTPHSFSEFIGGQQPQILPASDNQWPLDFVRRSSGNEGVSTGEGAMASRELQEFGTGLLEDMQLYGDPAVQYEQTAQSNGGYGGQQQMLSHGIVPVLSDHQILTSSGIAQRVRQQVQAFQRIPGQGDRISMESLKPKEEPYQVQKMAEMSHEFVFTNLEFQRPTRMDKVYILFYFTVQGVDLIYAMFKIPTVCICRAEQRYRAHKTLGIPCYKTEGGNFKPDIRMFGNITATRGNQVLNEMQLWELAVGLQNDNSGRGSHNRALNQTSPVSQQQYIPAQEEYSGQHSQDNGSDRLELNGIVLQTNYITEQEVQDQVGTEAIQEWACQRYAQSGLQRDLTELDKTGILKMAMGSATFISHAQFINFKSEFQQVLNVLKKFAKYWNYDDGARCIAEFGFSSREAVEVLSPETKGTCIIRMAQSKPGGMSITIVQQPNGQSNHMKQICHFLLEYQDLMGVRTGSLDGWFKGFGVESIMDPIRKKKFPRERLETDYIKLEDIYREEETLMVANST